MTYDFSGLTKSQKVVLDFCGWFAPMAGMVPQPSGRTVRKLIERGLVREHVNRGRGLDVTEYSVPIDVHIAWCDHCSRQNFPEVA